MRSPMRMIWVVSALGFSALCACSDDTKRTTLAEVRSPDGQWVARINQEQHFGPGTAGILGIVELQRIVSKGEPVQVLLLEQPDAHSDHLRAMWRSPSHLELGYRDAQVDFQAVKAGGIEIATTEFR